MKTAIMLGIVFALLLVSCSDKPTYNPEQTQVGGGCGVQQAQGYDSCAQGSWQDDTQVSVIHYVQEVM